MLTILKSFSIRANSFLIVCYVGLNCGPRLPEHHPERWEGSPELTEILRHKLEGMTIHSLNSERGLFKFSSNFVKNPNSTCSNGSCNDTYNKMKA